MFMINVVKIGGNVIDNRAALEHFLDDFAAMPGPKILVHGGGKEATRLSARLDIPTTMIEGRRVTDAATLEIVTMVYAGLINKRIVALLQARGVNAIGLCGADANILPATRRPANPIDYGFVGDINPDNVNHKAIKAFLDADMVPVFCAITRCEDSQMGLLLNSNADSVACAVAQGTSKIGPTRMYYCFEKPGVMYNVDDLSSVIDVITPADFRRLKADGTVHSGMLPKIANALKAVESGVESVIIISSDALNAPGGTLVKL